MEDHHILPDKILNDLQNANKYIFVHDFEKADEILQKLSLEHLENYEILFRRVEVSSRKSSLNKLILELHQLQKQNPNSKAIQFAIQLAKIKNFSTKSREYQDFSANHAGVFKIASSKPVMISNNKVKINRRTSVPDDLSYEPAYEYEDTFNEILSYHKEEPFNSAAWYLAGCIYEAAGHLEEAISKWWQAFHLNPFALSALCALAENHQISAISKNSTKELPYQMDDFGKYLIPGRFETHLELYHDFIQQEDFKNAIGALRSLADWQQKNFGNVPLEVEVLCLLGAMNAYRLDGNTTAAKACRSAVENIVIFFKKELIATDFAQLLFIAQLCEEYGLKFAAKTAYFSVLTTPEVHPDVAIEVIMRCMDKYQSKTLLECIKTACKIHPENKELRQLQTICSLKLKGLDPDEYIRKKNKIENHLLTHKSDSSLDELQNLVKKFDEDPEIHSYLGEIYLQKHELNLAREHFEKMYNLDSSHVDYTLKYLILLLHAKEYELVTKIAKKSLKKESKKDSKHKAKENEIRWCLACAQFMNHENEDSNIETNKALENEPWNVSFLILFLRNSILLDNRGLLSEIEFLMDQIERITISQHHISTQTKENLVEKITTLALKYQDLGFAECAWVLAKSALIVQGGINNQILDLLAKTGAMMPIPTVLPQLLLLLKLEIQGETNFNFSQIASCVATIYGLLGEWELTDEWIAMAQQNMSVDLTIQAKLFELQALSAIMKSSDFQRAQMFLETAIDLSLDNEKVPSELNVILGYTILAQGGLVMGLEKIKTNISNSPSLVSLYFYIKGLERTKKLDTISKDMVDRIYHSYPANPFEQKLVEEIFYTVGHKINGNPLGLAC